MKDHLKALIRRHDPLADVRPFLEEQDDVDLITRDNALRLLARSSSARQIQDLLGAPSPRSP